MEGVFITVVEQIISQVNKMLWRAVREKKSSDEAVGIGAKIRG